MSRKILQKFTELFDNEAELFASAPASVTLLGQPNCTSGGLLLACAIDRTIQIAFRRNGKENKVRVFSCQYEEYDEIDLRNIQRIEGRRWSNYLRGLLKSASSKGMPISGFDAAITGDIPQGIGLGSSAALLVCMANGLNDLFACGLSKMDIAVLSQEAENEFVGIQSAPLSAPIISAIGKEDSAFAIDCRNLQSEQLPFDLGSQNLKMIIADSGIRRGSAGSGEIARKTGLTNLHELTSLESYQTRENERVVSAKAFLRNANFKSFGELLSESDKSANSRSGMSDPESDLLMKLAEQQEGNLVTRRIDGGTLSIMTDDAATKFSDAVLTKYRRQTGKAAHILYCQVASGAFSEFTEPIVPM